MGSNRVKLRDEAMKPLAVRLQSCMFGIWREGSNMVSGCTLKVLV